MRHSMNLRVGQAKFFAIVHDVFPSATDAVDGEVGKGFVLGVDPDEWVEIEGGCAHDFLSDHVQAVVEMGPVGGVDGSFVPFFPHSPFVLAYLLEVINADV